MRSLQARLSGGLILGLVALTAGLIGLGGWSLTRLAEDFVATRLEHDMDALLAALRLDAEGRPLLDVQRLGPVFRQPYSGHYYKLRSPGGELRSRSLWDADLDLPASPGGAPLRLYLTGPDGQRLLALARTFRLQGRRVEILVTEDFTELAAGLRRLLLTLALLALPLLALLILGQRWLVRRGLTPLEQARRDILRLSQGELRRLDSNAPVEIRPLVEEINRLVELMQQRLSRSRHALGNLAHALKTPLTVLTQLADQPDASPPDALRDELGRQTRQLRALVERELKRARIAGGGAPGQRVVLAREIDDLLDTLRKIHRDRTLAVDCRVPPDSLFPGDRDDLLELLGNLLDNAFRHAAARVRLTAARDGGGLRLAVEDDGPGCSPEQLRRLTRRGVRIDEAGAGHGLGLAIVADIVEQYGGALRLGRSADLGGLLAEARLPTENG